jgi:hypothetical protein
MVHSEVLGLERTFGHVVWQRRSSKDISTAPRPNQRIYVVKNIDSRILPGMLESRECSLAIENEVSYKATEGHTDLRSRAHSEKQSRLSRAMKYSFLHGYSNDVIAEGAFAG